MSALGTRAGSLTAQAAAWTGLPEGIAVAVGNVDAHVTPPAANAIAPGQMVAIMGTSTCHVMNATALAEVPGMCGVVDGGIVAGKYGYEAGQSGVGDIFAWYLDHGVPADYAAEAARRGISLFDLLSADAAAQPAGAHGLIALDWLNGNRSVLVDHHLSGAIVGLTLATRPPDIYRALVESTAFGTRVILDAFAASGVPVTEFVAAGGLLKDRFVMQVYADVLRRPISVITSDQGPALGSAIHAAVAAGAYPDVPAAAAAMGGKREAVYTPDPASADVYDDLYAEYVTAARLLRPRRQRGDAPAAGPARPGAHRRAWPPGRLPRRKDGAVSTGQASSQHAISSAISHAREEVARLHAALVQNNLVAWTSGNVSARVPGADLMVIKPSGIAYADLSPGTMVLCDLDGNAVEDEYSPSSDTATHAYVYRHMPEVGGVVHTHSTYATAWAARGEAIPCVITAMADEFGGEIPLGPFALIGSDEIGRGIVSTLTGHRSPAVLMRSHGVFTIGATARDAVKAAVMCEDVARTVHLARQFGELQPLAPDQVDALHRRYTEAVRAALTSLALGSSTGGSLRKVASMMGRKPRIGILGIMQDLYDDMIPGIAERQEGYAAELAAHLADVAEFIPSKAIKYREDADPRHARVRECRPGRGHGRHAHLRAGHAGRPAAGRVPAAGAAGQHPARAERHPGVGHGRHDLQPGRARRAGHRQRHGPGGQAVRGAHRRLEERGVQGGRGPVRPGRGRDHRCGSRSRRPSSATP